MRCMGEVSEPVCGGRPAERRWSPRGQALTERREAPSGEWQGWAPRSAAREAAPAAAAAAASARASYTLNTQR